MQRVQRKRTKGFKLPENTVCVNRGTKWGNPFKVVQSGKGYAVCDPEGNSLMDDFTSKVSASAYAVGLYAGWLDHQLTPDGGLQLDELKGKNLACFCDMGTPCHADYLITLIKSNSNE
jgi:hypothetical protein